MQKTFITYNKEETRNLGKTLAGEIKKPVVICLEGELGAGKTTFTQGFLEGLGIEGPYTSPTFVIMKKYDLTTRNAQRATSSNAKKGFQISSFHRVARSHTRDKFQAVFHMDAYRVEDRDILDLGWEEIIAGENIVLVEWADRIKNIIPPGALKIYFEWLNENERKITFSSE